MEKIIVKKTATGYTAQIGEAKAIALTPNKDNYLELPANDLNRKYVSCEKIDKAEKQTITYDTVKETKKLGARTERKTPEYNETDKAAIDKIDAQIEQLKAKRKAITDKYTTKKPTKMDEMISALAKKFGKTEAEVRVIVEAEKNKKAGK